MTGKVNHGDLVVVCPARYIYEGSVVLCRVKGNEYLHIVKKIDDKGRYLIGNNRGGTNGWIHRNSIFGVMIQNKGKSNY